MGAEAIAHKDGLSLKRDIGLLEGVSLIVGSVIGSGIFITPKGVLQASGSVGLSLCAWAGCGLVSLLGALCYAELGTMLKQSGGEYVYIDAAIGDAPAFLYFWTTSFVLKPCALAILSMAFAKYTASPIFEGCAPPPLCITLLTVTAIWTVTVVNCYSVKLAARAMVFFTTVKLLVLALIIVGGIVNLARGETQHLATGFEGSSTSSARIVFAFYYGIFAFMGWNSLNGVTEEIKNPKRNLPLAIIISIPLITIVYILANVSYLTAMSKEELLASEAVGVLWAERVLGSAAILVPIGVACSTFGAATGVCLVNARLNFVAARKRHLPNVISYIHIESFTPLPAIFVTAILATVFAIFEDIYILLEINSFANWLFTGITYACLVVLRWRRPLDPRPFKVNIVIPIVMIIVSIYFVIAPIVDNPKIELIYGVVVILAGLIVYVPFVYCRVQIRKLEQLTIWLQLCMKIAPSKIYEEDGGAKNS